MTNFNLKVHPYIVGETKRIGINIVPFNNENKAVFLPKIRSILGREWCVIRKVWHVPYTKEAYAHLKKLFPETEIVTDKAAINAPSEAEKTAYAQKLSWQNRSAQPDELQATANQGQTQAQFDPQSLPFYAELVRYEELLRLKRYSINTIKTYRCAFINFLHFYREQDPKAFDDFIIRSYFLHQINVCKISVRTQNTIINAVKFYYEAVLEQDRKVFSNLRPRPVHTLPNVLSPEEVTKLLLAVGNIKHRCILMLIYSAGLRLSEVVNLQFADIDFSSKRVHIKSGKGKKDRIVMLAQVAETALVSYKQVYQPQVWLFENPDGGAYSKRSLLETECTGYFCKSGATSCHQPTRYGAYATA